MIDAALVGVYFAIMLGVGWRARSGSADAYWVAERRYGTFTVAASLVATIFGASSSLGIIGLGYSRGLTAAWWSLVGAVALVPFALVLAGRVRAMKVYTLPDILRRAYGERVAFAGAAFIVLAWCGVVAAQVVAGAYLLGTVLDLPLQAALAAVALVFVLYTLWGGQRSVVRTDAVQIFLFVGGLGAALALVIAAWTTDAAVPDRFLRFPVSPDFGWYQVLVFYPLIVGMPYLAGPDIYSRVLCARDAPTARRAALWAAAAVVPLSFLLASLGLLIHGVFPGVAPDAALPQAVAALAPTGLKGLIIISILGAVMSSADTTLISASTILSLNLVTPVANLDRAASLRLTRFAVVALGALAWGIAAFQEGIIASLLLAYTVFVGGVAVPTLASFWRERLGITSGAALAAVLIGGGTAILGELGDGAALRALLGDDGTRFLRAVLGPEYGSLLPVLLSVAVLLAGRGVGRGRER